MAVRVRLRRIGKNVKGQPHFRIAVFDGRSARDSRSIEELGFYSPSNSAAKVNKERMAYWIKNGAQLSPTVKSIVKKSEKK